MRVNSGQGSNIQGLETWIVQSYQRYDYEKIIIGKPSKIFEFRTKSGYNAKCKGSKQNPINNIDCRALCIKVETSCHVC